MGRPIEIRLDFDASGAEAGASKASAGIDKVADATDDLAKAADRGEDALGDLGDAGQDAGDEIERALKEAADKFRDLEKAAKDSSSDTETYWRDAAEEIERQLEAFSKTGKNEFEKVEESAEDAAKNLDRDLTTALEGLGDKAKTEGDGIGRGLKGGFDDASEGATELKENVQQEATEMASSFDGSAQSIADSAQTIIAEAFAGFGPIGAAAGIAAGIGIGFITKAFEESAQRAEDFRELIAEIRDELDETGEADFSDNLDTWIDENVDGLEDLERALGDAGITRAEFMQAMTGDKDAIEKVNEAWGRYEAAIRATGQPQKEGNDLVRDGIAHMNDLETATNNAREGNESYAEGVDGTRAAVEAENEAIEKNNALKAEQAGAAANAFLAEGEYAASVRDATAAISENGVTTDALTEAGQANREALVDLASASTEYATTAAETGKTQEEVNGILQRGRTDFLNAAAAAGMGADEANALADSLGLVPDNVTPTVKVDGAAQAQTDAKNTDIELSKMQGKVYKGKVSVDVDVPSSGTIGSLLNSAIAGVRANAVQVPVMAARTGVQARL